MQASLLDIQTADVTISEVLSAIAKMFIMMKCRIVFCCQVSQTLQQSSPDGAGMLVALIGRWGEEYAYHYLCLACDKLYEQQQQQQQQDIAQQNLQASDGGSNSRALGAAGEGKGRDAGSLSGAAESDVPVNLLATLGPGPYSVEWVNEMAESGLPYDILVKDAAGREAYAEVKSSMHHTKFLFPMSFRELEFAATAGRQYHVYRVFGVGSAAPSILRLVDPARLWHYKAISVCLQV